MTGRRIVLFDLDDTLYAERAFLHSGWRAVAAEAGRRGLAPEVAYDMMSRSDNAFDALNRALPEFGVDEMLRIYRSHMPDIRLYEDAEEALRLLAESGCAIGVITDGRSLTQRNKIAALSLAPVLEYTGISEETGCDKFSPEPFERAMRHFGHGNTFFYVGDNPAKDFLNPNSMGWHTVMLRERESGLNIHPQRLCGLPEAALPEFTVDSLADVPGIVLRT
ncbi:MAG: HAD family hydrolase [Muribaculaceae bacterium]|nr:HAD family hydrolase [Muribaculaceae bacterium]